ncbi:hypothetical protein JHV666_48870 [Mycobacterium avium subsp. hominissuis]
MHGDAGGDEDIALGVRHVDGQDQFEWLVGELGDGVQACGRGHRDRADEKLTD